MTYYQALFLAFQTARYRMSQQGRSQEWGVGWVNFGYLTNPTTLKREWHTPVTPRRLEWD